MPLCGSLPVSCADLLLHGGHAGHAADEDHLVDVADLHAGVVHGLLGGADAPVEQLAGELLQLGPGEGHLQMERAALVHGDEGLVDAGLEHGGELHLGLLGRFVEPLQGLAVLGQVDALLLAELVDDPVDDGLVEVVAAQVGVAVRGLHLEDAVAQLEDGDVEGAAAQVEDQDGLLVFFVEAVGQRGRGRLVDDALDFQTGDDAGVLGGLPLGVVEVGRDGDDRLGDLGAQEGFSVALEFLQDLRRDLRRGVLPVFDLHAHVAVGALDHLVGDDLHLFAHVGELAPHEALDGEDGVLGVGDGLPLGDGADQLLPGLGEGHNGRGGAAALGVRDDGRLAAFQHGHSRVGRAQVDADDLAHYISSEARSHGSLAWWHYKI